MFHDAEVNKVIFTQHLRVQDIVATNGNSEIRSEENLKR